MNQYSHVESFFRGTVSFLSRTARQNGGRGHGRGGKSLNKRPQPKVNASKILDLADEDFKVYAE
jgi:hypothetical protein